jgi:hypothetical protein
MKRRLIIQCLLLVLLLGIGWFLSRQRLSYSNFVKTTENQNEKSEFIQKNQTLLGRGNQTDAAILPALTLQDVNSVFARLSGLELPASAHSFATHTFKLPPDELRHFLDRFLATVDLKNIDKWVGSPRVHISDEEHPVPIDSVSLAPGHLSFFLQPRPSDTHPQEEAWIIQFDPISGVVLFSHINMDDG